MTDKDGLLRIAVIDGDLGALIIRGLALNDNQNILAGALPTAATALAIHADFELLDRVLIPRGRRLCCASG